MKVLSPSLTINTKEVVTSTINTDITIPNTGWVANTGDYVKKLDLAISGVLATDYIMIDILPDYEDIAGVADISKYCLEYAGGITLYAKNVPSASMSAKYTKIRGS